MITRIERNQLLEILNANKLAHRAIFEEAVEGYRAKASETLNENLDLLKANKNHRITIYLQAPEDHTHDYERIIKMIEMTTDEFVSLQEIDFKSYVMDDWQWSQQFYASNSSYSALAADEVEKRKASGEE